MLPEPENPFASPLADLNESIDSGNPQPKAERLRQNFLRHESSVRSLGMLYFVGGSALLIGSISPIIIEVPGRPDKINLLIVSLAWLAMSLMCFFAGYGLRRLERRTRIPIGILGTIGLFVFPPIGALANAYILSLVFGKKGKLVFSEEYHEAVRLTPHIRWRTTKAAWGLLIVLILAIIAIPIAANSLPQ